MFDKKALNPILERGFQSKSQVRYLLHMLRKYPSEYSWVKEALRTHGLPSEDGPLQTYWEGPYNKSPKTPSYVYKSRRGENMLFDKILKLSTNMKNQKSKEKVKSVVAQAAPFYLDESAAQETANKFWSLHGNTISKNTSPSQLAQFFREFEKFKPYQMLSLPSQEEAQKCLGDHMKARLKILRQGKEEGFE